MCKVNRVKAKPTKGYLVKTLGGSKLFAQPFLTMSRADALARVTMLRVAGLNAKLIVVDVLDTCHQRLFMAHEGLRKMDYRAKEKFTPPPPKPLDRWKSLVKLDLGGKMYPLIGGPPKLNHPMFVRSHAGHAVHAAV